MKKVGMMGRLAHGLGSMFSRLRGAPLSEGAKLEMTTSAGVAFGQPEGPAYGRLFRGHPLRTELTAEQRRERRKKRKAAAKARRQNRGVYCGQ